MMFRQRFVVLFIVIGLGLTLYGLHHYNTSIYSKFDKLGVVIQVPSQDSHSDHHDTNQTSSAKPNKGTFREALQSVAYPQNKSVILAMVDAGYVDMALNFYETSILPYGLSNMLFVSLIPEACEDLRRYNLSCFTYANDSGGRKESSYMSKIFLGKMNIRSTFTYEALSWGYSILQVDIDVLFFHNPYSYFTCLDCGIESLQDGIKNYINAGFLLIRSNSKTIQAYNEMVARAKQNPMSEDQANLNKIVHQRKVKYRVLDAKKFVCGLDYYESPKRYFADTAKPCPNCVVVHNNWIVSKPAKVYRFKEMLQWVVDLNGYYSSTSELYLLYNNSNSKPGSNLEKTALTNALAISQLLNRTLILPKFHCGKTHSICPLNSRYYIKHFDKYFPRYRESMFLSHPKVPHSVIQNQSPWLKVGSGSGCKQAEGCYEPGNSHGASQAEVSKWFGSMTTHSVLRFTDMYETFSGFSNPADQKQFDTNVEAGIKMAAYRQF